VPALDEHQRRLRDRLTAHVTHLAGTIGERHVWRADGLARAADYLECELAAAGCSVRPHAFTSRNVRVRNVEAVYPGPPESPSLVVGAHYDTVWGCPGANDNASGCAALLEIARAMNGRRPTEAELRLVGFVNEEPPFFQTGDMGSLRYARESRAARATIAGMISLETIGYFADGAGSQRYPLPLHRWYPATGDFIAFVSNLRSASFLRRAVAGYRQHAVVPAESAALPAIVPGVGWSDQWSFWQCGYPAIMITDTAPFRYPHYHTADDTPDQLDLDRFTLVVDALSKMVAALVGAPGEHA
jgi:Zn-dependent M28 family amino/carboxypeptidase